MSFISRFLPILVLGLSGVAFAGETPKVVVVPFTVGEGAPDVSAGRFTSQVTEELRTHDDAVEVVGAPTVRAPPGGKASKPSPEATLGLETGKKLLADLKFEEAAPALKKGIELSLADPASADYPAVLEAHVSLAVAYVRMGDDEAATKTMIALARMDPNYSIPSGYPPAFTREFERAKKKLEKQGKGSLSIEGPPGSTVFVDGRDLGMVPVLEEGLAWGPHYVKLEGSRGERFGQAVDVKGGMLKVKGNFGGATADKGGSGVPDPGIRGQVDENTCNRLQAYTKAAGAEYAVVGIVYRTGDQQLTAGAALYSAKRNGFVGVPDVQFDADALTSNVEAFKLAENIVKKVQGFGGSASLPLALVTRPIVHVGVVSASRESDIGGNTRKPKLTPDDNVRALGRKSELVDAQGPDGRNPNGGQVQQGGGPPKWIWVIVGVVVVAGASVGGYYAVHEATKPVTGTVSATW